MRRGILFGACVVALSGCASSRFDQLYEAGRYDDAIAAFAADSTLHTSERALFRAALAHATPSQPAYEPRRARALLEDLLRRFPAGQYHEEARVLAASLARADREESRIGHELDSLRARITALEQRIALQEALHDDLASGTVALRDTLERVQARLRVREGQLRALQQELRGLKQIDLGAIPPDTSRPH